MFGVVRASGLYCSMLEMRRKAKCTLLQRRWRHRSARACGGSYITSGMRLIFWRIATRVCYIPPRCAAILKHRQFRPQLCHECMAVLKSRHLAAYFEGPRGTDVGGMSQKNECRTDQPSD